MARRFDEPFDAGALERTMAQPSTARMYDWYLGGKDSYAVDREAAERVARAAPSLPQAARDNRAFMQRVVHRCVRDAGIDQVIDIGTGSALGGVGSVLSNTPEKE